MLCRTMLYKKRILKHRLWDKSIGLLVVESMILRMQKASALRLYVNGEDKFIIKKRRGFM